jgi:membrane protein DedA with SNARE-associated domain
VRRIFSPVGWAFDLILTILRTVGIPGLFALMVVESVGLPPLPSEVILPFAGVLLATGAAGFDWFTVLGGALAGGVTGAVIAYELGRWGGRALIHRWGARLGVGEEELDRVERFFARRGEITVFVARLIPLVRAYISYPAGTGAMDRARFILYTAAGAFPFTLALVYLGTVLGEHYTVLESYFNVLDIAVVAVALLLAVLYLLRRRARTRPRPT